MCVLGGGQKGVGGLNSILYRGIISYGIYAQVTHKAERKTGRKCGLVIGLFIFKTGSHCVALAVLENSLYTRLAWNL